MYRRTLFAMLIIFLLNPSFLAAKNYENADDERKKYESLHGPDFLNYLRENQERFDRRYESMSKKLKLIEKYLDERRITDSDQIKLISIFDKSIDNIMQSKILLNNRINEMKNRTDKDFITSRILKLESIKKMLELYYEKILSYNPPNQRKRRQDREDMHDAMGLVNFIRSFR